MTHAGELNTTNKPTDQPTYHPGQNAADYEGSYLLANTPTNQPNQLTRDGGHEGSHGYCQLGNDRLTLWFLLDHLACVQIFKHRLADLKFQKWSSGA